MTTIKELKENYLNGENTKEKLFDLEIERTQIIQNQETLLDAG